MIKKRIHNPRTGKYYQVRQRTTKGGKKGQIMGQYKVTKKSQTSTQIRQNFGDVLRALSKE